MSYEDKIEKAKEIISQFNERVGKDDAVDAEGFFKKLEKAGGTTEAALQGCSWEDLESMGLPKLLAKQIAGIFRKSEEKEKKPAISATRAQSMKPEELLKAYDPRDPSNAVSERLKKLSDGKPFIVFNPDETINAVASAKLLQEIRDNYPPRDTVVVDERPQKTYRVGERPDQMADENPLYPGRVLRPDGMCDQTNRSWNGISPTVRILIYLAVKETGEIKVNQINDAHNALDLVLSGDAEKKIRTRYTQASVRYDELEKQGNLPSLKIARSGGTRGKNDPFGHREY